MANIEIVTKEFKVGSFYLENYDTLKASIEELIKPYANCVIANTPEEIKAMTDTKAKLNKMKTYIDNYRKDKQKEYMKGFEVGKSQLDALVDLVANASENLKNQLDAYEKQQDELKLAQIKEIFTDMGIEDKFDKYYTDKYLNKGSTLDKIRKDLEKIKEKEDAQLNLLNTYPFKYPEERIEALFIHNSEFNRDVDDAFVQNCINKAKEKVEFQHKCKELNVDVENQDATNTKLYTFTLTIEASKSQLVDLTEYLKSNGITYKFKK